MKSLFIRNTQNTPARSFQFILSAGISLSNIRMIVDPTIDLNHQPRLRYGKIYNEC